MRSDFKKKIIIIQRRLTHYRVSFFNLLKDKLNKNGIELVLLVGEGTKTEASKGDEGFLDWSIKIPTKYFFNNKICFQFLGSFLKNASLVIVTQENKLLVNYFLIFNPRKKYQIAFWGHGANFQSINSYGYLEKFKKWMITKVDWWFTYSNLSSDLVAKAGMPKSKITTLNNSIDTTSFSRDIETLTNEDEVKLRDKHGIKDGTIGVFVGSLYGDKKIEFLLESSEKIKKEIYDFHLIIIGDGPLNKLVSQWCSERSWGHYVGTKFGLEKAIYLKSALLNLNPGLVGLGILDSFLSKTPLVTTDCNIHSPEIAYLENGANGLITPYNIEAYSKACVDLIRNSEAIEKMKDNCFFSAQKYTINNMVENFYEGIISCLKDFE